MQSFVISEYGATNFALILFWITQPNTFKERDYMAYKKLSLFGNNENALCAMVPFCPIAIFPVQFVVLLRNIFKFFYKKKFAFSFNIIEQ